MKTVVWVRKSGTTIELADTKNFRKMAKDNGWKKQTAAPPEPEQTINTELDMGDSNDWKGRRGH